MCGGIVLGHALSRALEREKRAAFVKSRGRPLVDCGSEEGGDEADEEADAQSSGRRIAADADQGDGVDDDEDDHELMEDEDTERLQCIGP